MEFISVISQLLHLITKVYVYLDAGKSEIRAINMTVNWWTRRSNKLNEENISLENNYSLWNSKNKTKNVPCTDQVYKVITESRMQISRIKRQKQIF